MESFQNNGIWWVPGTPDRVSGYVEFSPSEGVTLDLNDSLPTEEDEAERMFQKELGEEYPLIYGDLGHGGQVTVQDATLTSINSGGPEEYFAKRIFVGEHLPQNPSFVKAVFFADEIPEWTNSSIVRPVFETDQIEESMDVDEIKTAYAVTNASEYAADLGELEVSISNYARISSEIDSVEMETVGVFKVIPDGESEFGKLLEFGNHALEYLSFAVGTGIYPSEIQLYTDPDSRPINGYYLLSDYTPNRSSSKAHYLFRPNNADFETTFRNWIEHQAEAPEVHQNYRLLIHRSNLSPQLRFLTTVIALEALYDSKYPSETVIPEERFDEIRSDILEAVPNDSDLQGQLYGLLEHVVNYPSIKDKLTTLMESEQQILDTFFDIQELASEARKQRNAVAHGSIESAPSELYILSIKLQLVLEALISRELEVPAENLPNALASRHQGLMDHLGIGDN